MIMSNLFFDDFVMKMQITLRHNKSVLKQKFFAQELKFGTLQPFKSLQVHYKLPSFLNFFHGTLFSQNFLLIFHYCYFITILKVLAPIIKFGRRVSHKKRKGYLRSKECKFNLDLDEILVNEDFQLKEKHNSHLIVSLHH